MWADVSLIVVGSPTAWCGIRSSPGGSSRLRQSVDGHEPDGNDRLLPRQTAPSVRDGQRRWRLRSDRPKPRVPPVHEQRRSPSSPGGCGGPAVRYPRRIRDRRSRGHRRERSRRRPPVDWGTPGDEGSPWPSSASRRQCHCSRLFTFMTFGRITSRAPRGRWCSGSGHQARTRSPSRPHRSKPAGRPHRILRAFDDTFRRA